MQQVRETSAGKAISAYVILNRKGDKVAIVQAFHGNATTVNIWQDSESAKRCHAAALKGGYKLPAPSRYDETGFQFQEARASGYGYDKFTSSLGGLWIDGLRLADHCGETLKRPKRGYWLKSDKIPRGFCTANYGTFETATGARVDSFHWRDVALAAWRAENTGQEPEGEAWQLVEYNARRLAAEAESAGVTQEGYSSCYKESGLKYLEAFGYRVINAI